MVVGRAQGVVLGGSRAASLEACERSALAGVVAGEPEAVAGAMLIAGAACPARGAADVEGVVAVVRLTRPVVPATGLAVLFLGLARVVRIAEVSVRAVAVGALAVSDAMVLTVGIAGEAGALVEDPRSQTRM